MQKPCPQVDAVTCHSRPEPLTAVPERWSASGQSVIVISDQSVPGPAVAEPCHRPTISDSAGWAGVLVGCGVGVGEGVGEGAGYGVGVGVVSGVLGSVGDEVSWQCSPKSAAQRIAAVGSMRVIRLRAIDQQWRETGPPNVWRQRRAKRVRCTPGLGHAVKKGSGVEGTKAW